MKYFRLAMSKCYSGTSMYNLDMTIRPSALAHFRSNNPKIASGSVQYILATDHVDLATTTRSSQLCIRGDQFR